VSAVESFQAVAAVGAAAGVAGLLAPAAGRGGVLAHRAGSLAVLLASWLLLLGSLVDRNDLDVLRDRLDGAARLGGAALAGLVAVAITVLAVRLVIRRPVVLVVLLALAMPVRVPVSLGGDRGGNLLVPLYWVIVVGLIAAVVGAARGRLPSPLAGSTPLDVPVAAFTAFALASTAWSADADEATVKAVFFYIPFVLLYRLVIAWWPNVADPARAAGITTLALATAVAVVALAQFGTRTIWWNDTLQQGNVYNRFFRANGIFYDPNILGRYLMLTLIGAAAYAVARGQGRRLALVGAAAAVVAAGLVVTFSRSSALGLMVGIALVAARGYGARRTLAIGGAALVLIGGPAIALNENVRDKATSVDRLASTGEGRLRLAEGGVDLWRTAPVVGIGLGAFSESYRDTLPRRQQLRTRVVISHTAPVTVLAELGAVGFALFAVLSVAVLAILGRAARAARPDGWTEWAILAMLVAVFVHSLLYSGLFEDPFVWALAGAGMAAIVARRARETATAAPAPGV
jgi:O-antigen ligase